jgi:hypothetical protein
MRQANSPTLIETVLFLRSNEPAFSTIDESRLKQDGLDYYERELGLCGEFLVSRGTISREQLSLALAKQAELHGEYEKSILMLKKSHTEAIDKIRDAMNLLSVVNSQQT